MLPRIAIRALAYYRTSSAANLHGDSLERQQIAVRRYAAEHGIEIAAEHYDAAVSGNTPVESRRGFCNMLQQIDGSDIRLILIEDASRFARSMIVQELGIVLVGQRGVRVIAASGGHDLTETNDPSKVAMRQMIAVFSQLEKARVVAKLKAARDRASERAGRRVEGRKGYCDTHPELIREARRLARRSPKSGRTRSARTISNELMRLGYTTRTGKPFSVSQVQRLLQGA